MNPIVIAGSGLAGLAVAREFRRLDAATPVVVVTADDGVSYSKPMLSNDTPFGRAKNRRVQFMILDPSQSDCKR